MKAHYVVKGVKRRLILITPEDMNRYLTRPMLKDAIGMPAYFDFNKRVWPTPAAGIEVIFTSDAEEAA